MTAGGRDIPSHHARVDYVGDVWGCACGEGGRGRGEQTAGDLARAHQLRESAAIVAQLDTDRLGELLLAGEMESSTAAAAGLLVAHRVWLADRALREFVELDWNPGECQARVQWWALRRVLGEARRTVRILDQLQAPPGLLTPLEGWAARQPTTVMPGTGSELAVLRLAASLVTSYAISLYDDLSSLDNVNRGLALTAIGHLLSHGGAVPFTASMTWGAR